MSLEFGGQTPLDGRIETSPVPDIPLAEDERRALSFIASQVKAYYDTAESLGRVVMGGHGWDHVQRITGMAGVLSVMEGHKPFLPMLTTLVMDIGRTSQDPRAQNFKHGELSWEMVSEWVGAISFLTEEEKTLVQNAMEDHSKLNDKVRRSWVAEIVMDADRLDSLGAPAPVRAAATRWKLPLYGSQSKSGVEGQAKTVADDFGVRVLEWADMLWTKSAQKIAEPRVAFLKEFIREYGIEYGYMHNAFESLNLTSE